MQKAWQHRGASRLQESIAISVDGAEIPRTLRIIFKCGTDFGNEIRKIGFDHRGVRPEKVLQFSLRPYARPTRDQYLEEVKGFRRNVARLTRPKELTGFRIEDKFPKTILAHGPHPELRAKLLGFEMNSCGRPSDVIIASDLPNPMDFLELP
jgi:hypothetical protein